MTNVKWKNINDMDSDFEVGKKLIEGLKEF